MCALYDFPLAKLREYQPPLTRQPDFSQFWADTLAQAKGPLHDEVHPVDYPVPEVRVFDVCYEGFQGACVRACSGAGSSGISGGWGGISAGLL